MSKIAIVGHGNVGFHLAKKFSKDHEVNVFTRNPDSLEQHPLQLLSPTNFDMVFLTVPDSAVKVVSEQLEPSEAVIVHTSGSRPISDLDRHDRRGVFYPLQTFSKNKKIDFAEVQVFVEGTPKSEAEILALAKGSFEQVRVMSSAERAKIHLAAVFACNFSNHMFEISDRHLHDIGMKFQDLLPLVTETLSKAVKLNPSNSQTGPAVRNDQVTIDQHVQMLDDRERMIYEIITKNIQQTH